MINQALIQTFYMSGNRVLPLKNNNFFFLSSIWIEVLKQHLYIEGVRQKLRQICILVPFHGSHQKNWFKFQDFPGLFSHFSQDFLQSSRTFPGLLTKFQAFPGILWSCTNSNNKISLFQNKNKHLVNVYINSSSFYSKSKNKYLS